VWSQVKSHLLEVLHIEVGNDRNTAESPWSHHRFVRRNGH
jgi:hypothetical protein